MDCKKKVKGKKIKRKPAVKKAARASNPLCPKCGAKMRIKSGPRGDFFGCIHFRRNGCRGTLSIL